MGANGEVWHALQSPPMNWCAACSGPGDQSPSFGTMELDRSSVTRGERDAERLGVTNISFMHADARKVPALPETELIAVDPPRAGLAKGTRAAITASSAKCLVYVSCDVATWARDVAELEAAGWRLERAQPYDFYPQTHHIELLSLLTR